MDEQNPTEVTATGPVAKTKTLNRRSINKHGWASYKETEDRRAGTLYLSPSMYEGSTPPDSVVITATYLADPPTAKEARSTAAKAERDAERAKAKEAKEAERAAKKAARETERQEKREAREKAAAERKAAREAVKAAEKPVKAEDQPTM